MDIFSGMKKNLPRLQGESMKIKKGFTLVELLVVISIIALLLAILVPALGKAKKQAKGVSCLSQLRQWGLAFGMYTSEHNGKFPQGWTGVTPEDYGKGKYVWISALEPYYGRDKKMLVCPGTTLQKVAYAPNGVATGKQGPDVVWVEYDEQRSYLKGKFVSYAINHWVSDTKSVVEKEKFWRSINNTGKFGTSNIPVLMDGQFWLVRTRDTDKAPQYDGMFRWENVASSGEMCRVCSSRHGNTTNVLYMDFSVRRTGLKQLWRLKWHKTFDTGAGPVNGKPYPIGWSDWMKICRDY
jgi:prepilin-type N-terminal cleavage/methylation domain-containing protein/prepilin-type processing-associated H-X9-DG protein